jgi:fluoroquinolone resistance protein
MSLVDISGTTFDTVIFESCKLIGVRFDLLSTFLLSVDFRACLLKFSVFDRLKLKKTIFKDTNCEEVSFVEANLAESIFENCNLRGAIFEKTNLEKSDLRSSYAYTIDPEKNQIKKAKFSST